MTAEPLIYVTEIPECATPGCRSEGGCGATLLFCQPCADRLAVVRAEFDQETADFNPRNGNTHRFKQAICSSPYCFKARRPSDVFCVACQEAGLVEEAA